MVIIVNETKVIILVIYVVMRNGFDIFLYLIPLAIWLFGFFQQSQKKAKKKMGNIPQPVILEHPEKIEQKMEQIEQEMRQEEQERKKKATFLGRDPYKESIEYRKRKEKKLKRTTKVEESTSENDFSEIDWKRAVVYSEILRPRF